MPHCRLTSESQHEQKDLLFLYFRRKHTAVGNVSFFSPHSDCLVRSQGQLKIWPPSEIRGVLQFLSLALFKWYITGFPADVTVDRFCLPSCAKLVQYWWRWYSYLAHTRDISFAMSARQQIQLLQGCLLGRDVWRRNGGSFLHFDYIITSPIEEKTASALEQYSHTIQHRATQCALRSNIDKKRTIRRAIRMRIERTKDWRC